MHKGQNTCTRGCTLIEILVVVGILAILSALLLPLFLRAQESGRRTVCQSHLQQIGLATQQYLQDNNGGYYVARGGQGSLDPPYANFLGWSFGVFAYIKDPQVIECPSVPHDQADHFYHYGFNYLAEPTVLQMSPYIVGQPKPFHESSIANGATTWMFKEIQDIADENMLAVISSCGHKRWWDTRHSGGSNFLFFDGHIKWLQPQQIGDMDCLNPNIKLD